LESSRRGIGEIGGTMADIIGFYKGTAKNQEGISISDVLAMDDQDLERCHTYIQWVFPLPEKSKAVPSSPVLRQADIDEFRSDIDLQDTMEKVLKKMLDFYGLAMDVSRIIPIWAFMKKSENWLTPRNHNFLRLTRMIRSMKLLGLEHWAESLHDCLSRLYKDEGYKGIIGPVTKQFWDEAILKDV